MLEVNIQGKIETATLRMICNITCDDEVI